MTQPLIRPLLPPDWPAVRQIYEEGIATGIATLQTDAPDWATWDHGHLPALRLVAELGEIVGWAALSPVSSRPVYAGVAEVSIYIAEPARGRGVGSRLLQALITASEAAGIWTLQAGIFARNPASATLHERCGFRLVGRREKLGALRGQWQDILLYERRSRIVGAEG
jgi:L-amino acid N-acyltransferase YncA